MTCILLLPFKIYLEDFLICGHFVWNFSPEERVVTSDIKSVFFYCNYICHSPVYIVIFCIINWTSYIYTYNEIGLYIFQFTNMSKYNLKINITFYEGFCPVHHYIFMSCAFIICILHLLCSQNWTPNFRVPIVLLIFDHMLKFYDFSREIDLCKTRLLDFGTQ